MKLHRSFLIFLASVPLCAQTRVEGDKIPLKLADCIATALDRNSAIRLSRAKVAVAEARSDEAGTTLLPQLRLSGRAAEMSKVDEFGITLPVPGATRQTLFPSITENYSAKLSLQQPIFTGFRLKKNQEMAELNVFASKEEYSKDQADLVLNVTTGYWNLYRAYRLEEVISQSVEQVAEHLKDIRNFAKQGVATDVDVMKVQVQHSDIKVKQIEARSNIRLAAMSLNSLLGNSLELFIIPADEPVIAEVSSSESGRNEDLSALISLARTNRPELKVMQYRKEISDAGVTAAQGGWYPQVVLAANYDYARPNQRIIPPREQWDGTWDVGVNLQWNVWDWFATKYQTSQAEAAVAQAEAGLIQMHDAVTLDVAQQYFKSQETKEKVGVAQDGVKQANESYRITNEKFKRGLATNTELLDAEVALLQAKLTSTQAIVDHVLTLARLKKAVGK